MVAFVGIHFGKNVDFREDFAVIFSLFDGGLLDNVLESGPVKLIQLAGYPAFDGGSSGRVVHQGKLTESLANLVSLQVGGPAVNHLFAVVLAAADNIEGVAFFSFSNHSLSFANFKGLSRLDDTLHVLFVEVLEEDGFLQKTTDLFLSFGALLDNFGFEVGFLVVFTKHLSADPLSAVFLTGFFHALHFFFEFLFINFIIT